MNQPSQVATTAKLAYRASWSRLVLDHAMAHLPASERIRVREQTGGEALTAIEHAGPLEWLPAQHHSALLAALHEVLGGEGLETFFRKLSIESFDRPIFRSIVEGGRRIFGATPAHGLKLYAHGIALIARDIGHFSARVDDPQGRRGTLVWEQVPMAMRTDAMARAVAGGVGALLDVFGLRGEVTRDTSRLHLGRASFTLEWV